MIELRCERNVLVSRCGGLRSDPFAVCIFFNTVAAKTTPAIRRNGATEKVLASCFANCLSYFLSPRCSLVSQGSSRRLFPASLAAPETARG